jgi:hypothetical protein
MNNASTAGCVGAYDGPNVGVDAKDGKPVFSLKSIPWMRILVDAVLVAAILLISSSFLSVR